MSIFRRLWNGSRPTNPKTDPTSIGNLAIAKGYATEDQVQRAVALQEIRTPLGEIMVDQGILTPAQLDELLLEQEVIRRNMNDKEAAELFRGRRRQEMKEVTNNLRGVATTLACVADKGRR